MRILNLNESRFEDNDWWRRNSTAITDVDPLWRKRSLLVRVVRLLSLARGFDVVLFHRDVHLAAFYGLIGRIFHSKTPLVFQGFEYDVSRDSKAAPKIAKLARQKISRLLHSLVVHRMNVVVVHTRAEVDSYSQFFKVPGSRFNFIPYFHYGPSVFAAGLPNEVQSAESSYVLALGRHRDFDCFVQAARGSDWQSVIVAGKSDRQVLEGKLPDNVTAHYEVSREEYRDYISRAALVVIPLHADRWQRALGHIAMFEAMVRGKAIVAAETFQLSDYAGEGEVLFYQPGNAAHLREQIERLLGDENLRRELSGNAYKRLLAEFTREKYIARLVDVCGLISKDTRTSQDTRASWQRI